MPRLDARDWHSQEYRERAFRWIDRGVGGFGVFLGTMDDTAKMIADVQAHAGGRLLIGADFEHGLAMRLEGAVAFPRAMALGRTVTGITEHVAAAIAEEMRALGVHWNWAPVCDINSDPRNPIINTRSFGENAEVVSEHAVAYITGLQKNGILACAKHVPGHGDTAVDSHLEMPRLTVERAVADVREFVPFRAAIAAGVGSLMIGHMLVPFLDDRHPASLSPAVVTDLVRREWGFTGLITTDALDMGAITGTYDAGTAAVRAIAAGNDVVLLPANVDEAIDALERAVEDGTLSPERIEQSVQRWKAAMESMSGKPPVTGVDQNAHAAMALQAGDAAIRMQGQTSLLPVTQHEHIAAFAVIDEADADAATSWFGYLAQAMENNVDMGFIDGTVTEEELAEYRSGIEGAGVIVFAFFGRAVAHRGRIPGVERVPEIMRSLAGGRPTIVVACGSPYGVEDLPADLTLYTYSDTLPSVAASVLRLVGRAARPSVS
jgi:beta-glucosidase-like glycosyl hydrolase